MKDKKTNIGTDKIDSEYEKCVICHKLTEYKVNQDISERRYFIEGCGQLCEDCYLDIKLEEGIDE